MGASPYGVLDMAGNMWEWVNDWHMWGYYTVSPGSNPQGPDSGVYKVLRGGSWIHGASSQRVAVRAAFVPTYVCSAYGGIRCAASP